MVRTLHHQGLFGSHNKILNIYGNHILKDACNEAIIKTWLIKIIDTFKLHIPHTSVYNTNHYFLKTFTCTLMNSGMCQLPWLQTNIKEHSFRHVRRHTPAILQNECYIHVIWECWSTGKLDTSNATFLQHYYQCFPKLLKNNISIWKQYS